MSQNDFTQCGFILDGSAPALSPLNGWFWPFSANGEDYDPGVFLPPPDAIYFPVGPGKVSIADFDRLYWRIKRLEVSWTATDGILSASDGFTVSKAFSTGLGAFLFSDEEYELSAGNIPYIRYDDADPSSRRECRFIGGADPSNGIRLYFNNSQVSQGDTEVDLALAVGLDDGGIVLDSRTAVGMSGVAPVSASFLGYAFTLYTLNPITSGTVTIDVPASDGYYSYNGRFNTDTGAPL